jgi:poly(3-hydroxybutyrate) depolymerase
VQSVIFPKEMPMQSNSLSRRDLLVGGVGGTVLGAWVGQADASEVKNTANQAAAPLLLKPGTHRLEMPEAIGANAAAMNIFIHQPNNWTTRDGIMIVMHGTKRDADRYLATWIEHASATNTLLITPEFNAVKFPGRSFYNFGNVVDSKMQAKDRSQWTFDILDRVFDYVRQTSGAQRDSYALYGHSAGAQFVHRFMLLASASKAQVMVSANAGSYTMPVYDVQFPWGLKNTAVTPADLRRAFARNVVILLGDQDIDPNHLSLPRDPQAMAQGPHRLARGQLFFETAKKTAASLNTTFAWRLQTVEGVEHVDEGMAAAAISVVAQSMKTGS